MTVNTVNTLPFRPHPPPTGPAPRVIKAVSINKKISSGSSKNWGSGVLGWHGDSGDTPLLYFMIYPLAVCRIMDTHLVISVHYEQAPWIQIKTSKQSNTKHTWNELKLLKLSTIHNNAMQCVYWVCKMYRISRPRVSISDDQVLGLLITPSSSSSDHWNKKLLPGDNGAATPTITHSPRHLATSPPR